MNPNDHLVKVMIGRFQPFHNGHLRVLRAAIATSSHVVVMIGSAQSSRTLKNPWLYVERKHMILGSLTPEERQRVSIGFARDYPGQDRVWVEHVKGFVEALSQMALPEGGIRYTLVGCHKGAETYYLELYKDWNQDLIPADSETINATDIRRVYFDLANPYADGSKIDAWGANLPGCSYGYLCAFRNCADAYYTLAQGRAQETDK